MPTIQFFLSQANRGYSTLTRQLEAVIIEVSVPPTIVAYSHTGVHYGQVSYFNMKAFLLAEPACM